MSELNASTTLSNVKSFEDIRKEVKAEGATVKSADRAGVKAADSLPNVAKIIVRNSKSGGIDLEKQPDATTILHRDYREATGKAGKAQSPKSEGVQVSKLNAFYYLGTQKAFDGEAALDMIGRIFKRVKEAEAKATKDAPSPYPKVESKFNAWLQAARCINDAAGANPARFPRLDDKDTSDWRPDELPDTEIIEAMKPQTERASKNAKAILDKIVKQLDSLIRGASKDDTGETIKDNSKAVVDAHAILKAHAGLLTIMAEKAEFEARAIKLGVSLQALNNAENPKPRVGRRRSQRRG